MYNAVWELSTIRIEHIICEEYPVSQNIPDSVPLTTDDGYGLVIALSGFVRG